MGIPGDSDDRLGNNLRKLDEDTPKKFKYACLSAVGCIIVGNDLIMPAIQDDYDDIVRSVGADQGSATCPISLGNSGDVRNEC